MTHKGDSYKWWVRDRCLEIGVRPLVMGIVNVTPDSFSDGGQYCDPERALDHALALVAQGADLLDIGAESTRPGAPPVDEEEELRRLIPVLTKLAGKVPVPISVDTMKSRVAQAAVDAGASIINDVTALRFDPEMASVVAKTGAGVVLMHMQGVPQTMQIAPQYDDVVREVSAFLGSRLAVAEAAGIARSRIVLDPGIGFGKLLEQNMTILRELRAFMSWGCPVLVGVSRKSFLGKIIDRPVAERVWGTAAAVALAVERGAAILRVHDVKEMVDVVKVAASLKTREPEQVGDKHA